MIEASLLFSNRSPAAYFVRTGTSSIRTADISFYAADSAGQAVPDPLGWYFGADAMMGGIYSLQNIGEWKTSLPVNPWLRFDRPGRYTIYAYSNRVQEGDANAGFAGKRKRVELVSEKMEIEIGAPDPETEARLIREAREEGGGKTALEAAEKLLYLQTPAARTELISLLGKDEQQAYYAMFGLYSAPDRAGEAARLLAGVKEGRLHLKPTVQEVYVRLKTSDLVSSFSNLSREEVEKRGLEYQAAWKKAVQEITEAAAVASGGKGKAYHDLLLTQLFQNPDARKQALAELAKVQTELDSEQGKKFISDWQTWGGEEFLPLLRKMTGAPDYNSDALAALARLRPKEARALIVEDILGERPRYLVPGATKALLSLPAAPIPELEPYFRKALADPKGQIEPLILLIDRYGTPSLLPEVLGMYTPKEGRWACSIQAAFLRYWIRCDAPDGVEALSRALNAREHTRCYRNVLGSVLLEGWDEAALPVVANALQDGDIEVLVSAVKVLERNADAKWIPACIEALERANEPVPNGRGGRRERDLLRGAAETLLESRRWKFDAAQKEILRKITALPAD